jgi:hypothetical protein
MIDADFSRRLSQENHNYVTESVLSNHLGNEIVAGLQPVTGTRRPFDTHTAVRKV